MTAETPLTILGAIVFIVFSAWQIVKDRHDPS